MSMMPNPPPTQGRDARVPHVPEHLALWGLLWGVWTAIAVAQAALVTAALGGGARVFVYSLLLFGSVAWLWVAMSPALVILARRVPWPGLRNLRLAAVAIVVHSATLLVVSVIQ